jgi:hypothetical protein
MIGHRWLLLLQCLEGLRLAGAQVGGPGAAGGGSSSACTEPPCAASLLGDVAFTTVAGTDERTGKQFPVGENIFGPFEAGFTEQQNFILEGLGCANGNDGHVAGGIDTAMAEQMVAWQCSITLPRCSSGVELPCPAGDDYISLLDECGGHTNEYHFHERLTCLYDDDSEGHSPQIGIAEDGNPVYGQWEATGMLPELDACGGHFGVTPDSNGVEVYHYHVQDAAPFTIGCFGPASDGGLVSVEECRGLYDSCGDGDIVELTTAAGTVRYDLWCPCFDSSGSNVDDSSASAAAAGEEGGAGGTNTPTPAPAPDPADGAAAAGSGCVCPDGSTPTFTGGPPCSGGPPTGADCPPPPDSDDVGATTGGGAGGTGVGDGSSVDTPSESMAAGPSGEGEMATCNLGLLMRTLARSIQESSSSSLESGDRAAVAAALAASPMYQRCARVAAQITAREEERTCSSSGEAGAPGGRGR